MSLTVLALLRLFPAGQLPLDGFADEGGHSTITDKRADTLPDFIRESDKRRLDS